ncbi:MAG: DUF3828 domain-containing protein [Sphingomonadaceae bacterium]
MRPVTTLLAGLALIGAPANAQPAPQLPPAVAAAVKARMAAFAAECRADGGRAARPPTISTAFLNADDLPDIIFDFERARCSTDGAMGGHCGQLGCTVEIFISRAGSWVKVADITTPAWKVDRSVRPHRFLTAPEGPSGPWRAWGMHGQKFVIASPVAAPERGQPAAAPATAEDAPVRAAIDRFYAQYRQPFSDNSNWTIPLSPAFQRAWDHALGPDGALGFDPFCACQDYEPREFAHRIDRITMRGATADVVVGIRSFRQEGFTPIRMVMQRQPDGQWLIDDLPGARGASMKAEMARARPGSWSQGD